MCLGRGSNISIGLSSTEERWSIESRRRKYLGGHGWKGRRDRQEELGGYRLYCMSTITVVVVVVGGGAGSLIMGDGWAPADGQPWGAEMTTYYGG